MQNRVYVGNLAEDVSADDVRQTFSRFGEVTDVHLVKDASTGRSRGFAFVTMADEAQAQKAIAGMNGTSVGGRPLTVNIAQERSGGPRRGGRR